MKIPTLNKKIRFALLFVGGIVIQIYSCLYLLVTGLGIGMGMSMREGSRLDWYKYVVIVIAINICLSYFLHWLFFKKLIVRYLHVLATFIILPYIVIIPAFIIITSVNNAAYEERQAGAETRQRDIEKNLDSMIEYTGGTAYFSSQESWGSYQSVLEIPIRIVPNPSSSLTEISFSEIADKYDYWIYKDGTYIHYLFLTGDLDGNKVAFPHIGLCSPFLVESLDKNGSDTANISDKNDFEHKIIFRYSHGGNNEAAKKRCVNNFKTLFHGAELVVSRRVDDILNTVEPPYILQRYSLVGNLQ